MCKKERESGGERKWESWRREEIERKKERKGEINGEKKERVGERRVGEWHVEEREY